MAKNQLSFQNFYDLSLEEIGNALKLQLNVPWSSSLNSLTIFRIKDDLFVAYNFDVKMLIKEVNKLHEYYVRLFSLVEIWRNENPLFKITNLKIKNWENLNTDRLNKSFSVIFKVINTESLLGDVCSNHLELLEKLHVEVVENLGVNRSTKLVQEWFEFPEEIKTSCQQYLLYFTQFLQDLGINATRNLKEEAGKVLFSVTPTDDVEALDKIREALAVYLNLPSSPVVYDESFAARRVKQQIYSLKHSQQMAETEFRLRMAQNLVEAQHKTIEDQSGMIVQQAIFIQQQKEHIEKITNPAVMINSAENKEELEEIYDGLKIGESKFLKEQLGIHLNPAKVIKTVVKNTFGKEENKSVLGLDEETGDKD